MRKVMVAGMALLAFGGSALAQSTEAERREACTGDALKLCLAYIPDRDQIRQCLLANRAQLAPACRAVLDGGRPPRSGRG